MNRVYVHGWGAVSPAGWGCGSLVDALNAGVALTTTPTAGPNGAMLPGRRVPTPTPRPAWMAQARLRRSSLISQFTVGAVLEALAQAEAGPAGPIERARLGVVFNVFGGSVIYSRRFFEEVLVNPAQASPLLFPETVFNAPASHLAAVLGSRAPNHTLVSDQSGFLQGLSVAADWLADGNLEACVVVGAEEWDWSVAVAARLFDRASTLGEGAGALVLRRAPGPVELQGLSDPVPYVRATTRRSAAGKVRDQLQLAFPTARFPELRATAVLGDGLAATGAWECAAAVAGVAAGGSAHQGPSALVITGATLQAQGVCFARSGPA